MDIRLYLDLIRGDELNGELCLLPFSNSSSEQLEGALLSRRAATLLGIDANILHVVWTDAVHAASWPQLPFVSGLHLVGSFKVSQASKKSDQVLVPSSCYLVRNGDKIEIKHLRLVLCPSVPSHRLKQAAMPREPTLGADPCRCVMAELFDVTSEPGTGSSKITKIESWLWDWAMPRQLSFALRTPEVVRSWIRGWSTRDNHFISVLTYQRFHWDQALGAVAAYLSLRYAPLLLGLYGTLDSSFKMSIDAAFEAFGQGTPAGVKLHIELANLLAYVTHLSGLMRCVWTFLLMSIAFGETAFISLLSLAGVILGFKVYLGCVSDALNISLHLHWAIINVISTYIFHYHLIALKHSWNIMRRGKKPRKDEDQETPISIEHIVAGVLLFVPLLSLFSTTAVFHGLTLMASTASSLPGHMAALILSRITRVRSKETPQRIVVTPLHCSDIATVYELRYM
jgi:hypothetical protein